MATINARVLLSNRNLLRFLINKQTKSTNFLKINAYSSISLLNNKLFKQNTECDAWNFNKKILIQNQQIKRFYSTDKLNQQQVEEKVLNIFNNFDRIKENPAKVKVTLESHVIKDLGLDSLDHVEIIVQLEDTFGFEIPDSDYEKLYTPKEIVNYLLKRLEVQ